MRNFLAYFGFMLKFFIFMTPAQADDCIKTLIQDVRGVQINSASTYAMTELINRNLSSSQQNELGATIPIKGVPVSLNSSSAKNLSTQFFQQTGVSWDHKTMIGLVSQTLSNNSVEAYRTCIDGQHVDGPRAFAYDATPREITVKVRWISSPHAPTSATATYDFSGVEDKTLQTEWTTGEDRTFIFQRKRGMDFRFTVTIGGKSDRLFVPHLPQVRYNIEAINKRYPRDPNETIRMANDGTGRNQGPITHCENAPNGTEIDPSISEMNITLKVGALDHTTYAKITRNNTQQVCYEAFLRPLAKEGGGDFRFFMIYGLIKRVFTINN